MKNLSQRTKSFNSFSSIKLMAWLSLSLAAVVLMTSIVLQAQGGSLTVQRADLQQEVERYKNDIVEERRTSQRFLDDKTRLLEQKQAELIRLNREIQARQVEINEKRRENSQMEAAIASIEQQETFILGQLRIRAQALAENIKTGIPFDQELRQSALTSIIIDSRSPGISVGEILNRLDAFLKSEQNMAYDSQVLRAIINVEGNSKTVDLLRVGRVFFAIDTGADVFQYVKDATGSYILQDGTSVNFVAEKNIRDMIAVIQGKLPPDLISIRLPATKIEVRGSIE